MKGPVEEAKTLATGPIVVVTEDVVPPVEKGAKVTEEEEKPRRGRRAGPAPKSNTKKPRANKRAQSTEKSDEPVEEKEEEVPSTPSRGRKPTIPKTNTPKLPAKRKLSSAGEEEKAEEPAVVSTPVKRGRKPAAAKNEVAKPQAKRTKKLVKVTRPAHEAGGIFLPCPACGNNSSRKTVNDLICNACVKFLTRYNRDIKAKKQTMETSRIINIRRIFDQNNMSSNGKIMRSGEKIYNKKKGRKRYQRLKEDPEMKKSFDSKSPSGSDLSVDYPTNKSCISTNPSVVPSDEDVGDEWIETRFTEPSVDCAENEITEELVPLANNATVVDLTIVNPPYITKSPKKRC